MNKEQKVERMEKVVKELQNLEGVKYAILDDYEPSTANSGQIAVRVEFNNSWFEHGEGHRYKLDADLRSVSQKMRHVLKSSELMNSNVYQKPERVYNAVGDGVGHDSNMYMVEVIP